jgi:hypothetical protein
MNKHLVSKTVLTVMLFCLFAETGITLNPQHEYQALPADYGIIYREFKVVTDDSITIRGWFMPAQDTLGITNFLVGHLPVPERFLKTARPYQTIDSTRRPTVIICNGDAGNMAYLIYHAYHLFTAGFNVVLFDWRGFGHSDKWPAERNQLCYSEYLDDYRAVIGYTASQPEVDPDRIGLFGFSTGAYLSFAMAAESELVSAYAGRALMTSFDDVLPILKKLAPERNLCAPEDYPVELEPINASENIDIPVFLIVGENDDRTPVWMSEKIVSKLKGPKQLWIVESAGHGGANGPEYVASDEFFSRLGTFFYNAFSDN